MKDKKVIVIGAGKSGLASSGLLLRQNAYVTLYDGKTDLNTEEIYAEMNHNPRFKISLGELTDEILEGIDICVISPGVPTDAGFMEKVGNKGIPIWGEIELAYYLNKGRIAAITGTNGKTTTTTLVGEIFKERQDDTLVVGNIGLPFTRLADSTDEDTLIALEVSSFQLETIHTFKPHVAAILNLTPDHLNRHHTLDNYYNTKFRITENQTEDDYIVLNYDDPEIRSREGLVKKARKIYFSRKEVLKDGVSVDGYDIIVSENGEKTRIMDVRAINILGDHNLENVLAAVAVTYYMGIPAETIERVVGQFNGVEHRIEFVRELDGVRYYNDSKGTNPDAAIKAIKAMQSSTLLIGGGYDKQSEYDEWIESFDGKVRYLVLLGETASAIEACCKRHGFNQIVMVDSLEDAVKFCHENAIQGENVLLSPACASWDMFPNFEVRGEMFKKYVNEL